MNSTMNNSSILEPKCSLKERVYTRDYLFFKLLNSTYLRLLIGPGILLNTLCLIVLTQSRLSNKSTTIFFLRFLAIFDILAITLKYIRAELNYQSVEKMKNIPIITNAFCQAIYVCLNTCISITMWTIVLMSVDKVIAVSYPLKSSIWLTQKRVSYICYCTSFILLLANLSFIVLAGAHPAHNHRQYCGLNAGKNPLALDIITASVLPIVLITAANIIIAVVLRRVSRTSFNWSKCEDKSDLQNSELDIQRKKRQSTSSRSHIPVNTSVSYDSTQASKRRTSAQVTRMLLAVTLSLILFNIPNTIISLFTKLVDTKRLLREPSCNKVSAEDIRLYKIGSYSSVIQDILSDLPHIVNFFLYCLAGKKFRSIIIEEVHRFLIHIHLMKRKERRSTATTHLTIQESLTALNQRRTSSRNDLSSTKRTSHILSDGTRDRLMVFEGNIASTKDHCVSQTYSALI